MSNVPSRQTYFPSKSSGSGGESFVRSTGYLVSDANLTDQALGITPGNPGYPLMPILTVTGLFTLGGTGNDNSFSVVNTFAGPTFR